MRSSQQQHSQKSTGVFSQNNRIALKEQLLARLKAETGQKSGKGKFTEIFISSKQPKQLTQAFHQMFQSELAAIQSNLKAQEEFREKFFKDTLLPSLAAKQYKKRKNAFYILAHLVQNDAPFVQVALKQFHKIKDILFKQENLPDLTSLDLTADYLKFKVFVSQVIQDWIDKHSGTFPDLFIWKKMQQQYLQQQQQTQSDQFSEKYQQLRIYRVIYERNSNEMQSLKQEFLKIKFECTQAKRLMLNQESDLKEPQVQEEVKFGEAPENFEANQNDSEDVNFLEELLMGQEVSTTQNDAPASVSNQNSKFDENKFTIDVQSENQKANQFKANAKNLTLYRVLADNRKILERRILPLIEMFKVETAFFQQVQYQCLTAVREKEELGQEYRGRIKINNKDLQDFNTNYKQIGQDEIQYLTKSVESLQNNVNSLFQDLNMIRLRQEISDDPKVVIHGDIFQTTFQPHRNQVEILDEEEEQIIQYEDEDADEHLFK